MSRKYKKEENNDRKIIGWMTLAVAVVAFLIGISLGSVSPTNINKSEPLEISQTEVFNNSVEKSDYKTIQNGDPPEEEDIEKKIVTLAERRSKLHEDLERTTKDKTWQPQNKKIIPIAKRNVTTGYDATHPILNDDGLCTFTIDNTRNDMPVYVRIWDIGGIEDIPVWAFTTRQYDSFTAENLSPGYYEVRYREIYENDVPPFGSKSEPTKLEQMETLYDISYSTVELTLYKVVNGNTTTTQIPADEV